MQIALVRSVCTIYTHIISSRIHTYHYLSETFYFYVAYIFYKGVSSAIVFPIIRAGGKHGWPELITFIGNQVFDQPWSAPSQLNSR